MSFRAARNLLITLTALNRDDIVFDHREDPKPQLETDTLDGLTIRSYVIPVVQKRPSEVQSE